MTSILTEYSNNEIERKAEKDPHMRVFFFSSLTKIPLTY